MDETKTKQMEIPRAEIIFSNDLSFLMQVSSPTGVAGVSSYTFLSVCFEVSVMSMSKDTWPLVAALNLCLHLEDFFEQAERGRRPK